MTHYLLRAKLGENLSQSTSILMVFYLNKLVILKEPFVTETPPTQYDYLVYLRSLKS